MVQSVWSIRFGKLIAATLLGSAVLLSACGFHLRTSNNVPPAFEYLELSIPAGTESDLLRQPLINQLVPLGIKLDQRQGHVLRIVSVRPSRQLLNGRLTEVQLGLAVDVQLEDAQTGQALSAKRTLMARRSYQYDIATVNTENQQEALLKQELYQEIASLIARQLSTGRIVAKLPTP